MSRYFLARGEDRQLDAQTRSQLRGDYVSLSAGITHYELRGPANGALVVLVPGLTIPLFYWDGLVSELHTRGLRTLAYSAYGRGYSDRVQATYDATLFVRQLADLLRAVEASDGCHLVASSMGALVAIAAVDANAVPAASLTLIGPAGLQARSPLPPVVAKRDLLTSIAGRLAGQRALRKHLAHNVESPALAETLTAMITDAYRYEGSMYSLLSTLQAFPLANQQALYQRTASAGVPIQLLWGARDQVTPIAGLNDVQSLLALQSAHVHVIDASGHMVPFEQPATTSEMIASFVALT